MGKHAAQGHSAAPKTSATHSGHARHASMVPGAERHQFVKQHEAAAPQLPFAPAAERLPAVLANARQRRRTAPLAHGTAFVTRLRRPAKGFSVIASGAFALMAVVGPYSMAAAPAYADSTHTIHTKDHGADQASGSAETPDASASATAADTGSTTNDQSVNDGSASAFGNSYSRSTASSGRSTSSGNTTPAATSVQDVTSPSNTSDTSTGYDRDAASASAPPSATGGDPTPSSGSPKAYAAAEIAKRGWASSNYGCLVKLWNRESHWSTTASNPSGAYGIPQALPGRKMASAGPNWRTNAHTQIDWGLGYIAGRYGTPCQAWGHSQSTGWY